MLVSDTDEDRPLLVQHIIRLDYVGHDLEHALFCSTEPGDRQPTKLLLRMAIFEDMREPDQLTVHIRPGNAITDIDAPFLSPSGE